MGHFIDKTIEVQEEAKLLEYLRTREMNPSECLSLLNCVRLTIEHNLHHECLKAELEKLK